MVSDAGCVDCYIDCWEGSYRELLAPGVLGERYASLCYPFARRVLTINNVDDAAEVRRQADAVIQRGECDAYVFVAHELPRALKQCGLSRRNLGRLLHFNDFLLVTVATAQAPYVLHVAGDVVMSQRADWVSDAVAKLAENDELLVANPNWSIDGGARVEALRYEEPYWIGFGFSDQCFLGSAQRLAAPIYSEWNAASNRYPMTQVGRIFEARVDAYMRNHNLLRITDGRVTYEHRHYRPQGSTYQWPRIHQRLALTVRRRLRDRGLIS